MPDNKKIRDGRDRSKVDSKDASEVEHVHQKHKDKSHQEVKDAIKKAGPVRKNVERKLGKGK